MGLKKYKMIEPPKIIYTSPCPGHNEQYPQHKIILWNTTCPSPCHHESSEPAGYPLAVL